MKKSLKLTLFLSPIASLTVLPLLAASCSKVKQIEDLNKSGQNDSRSNTGQEMQKDSTTGNTADNAGKSGDKDQKQNNQTGSATPQAGNGSTTENAANNARQNGGETKKQNADTSNSAPQAGAGSTTGNTVNNAGKSGDQAQKQNADTSSSTSQPGAGSTTGNTVNNAGQNGGETKKQNTDTSNSAPQAGAGSTTGNTVNNAGKSGDQAQKQNADTSSSTSQPGAGSTTGNTVNNAGQNGGETKKQNADVSNSAPQAGADSTTQSSADKTDEIKDVNTETLNSRNHSSNAIISQKSSKLEMFQFGLWKPNQNIDQHHFFLNLKTSIENYEQSIKNKKLYAYIKSPNGKVFVTYLNQGETITEIKRENKDIWFSVPLFPYLDKSDPRGTYIIFAVKLEDKDNAENLLSREASTEFKLK